MSGETEPSASSSSRTFEPEVKLTPQEHHKQQDFCYSRAKYRQGKEFKAVKVYTILDESKHMIIQNIPDVGLHAELEKLCRQFGAVQEFKLLSGNKYPPPEEFTKVYYVKYASVNQARYAKIKLDNRAFYGGLMHICYAPELETEDEMREKLSDRNRYVQNYSKRMLRKRKASSKRDFVRK